MRAAWKPVTLTAALAMALTACGGSSGESQLDTGGSTTAPSVAAEASFEAGTTMAELSEAGTIRVGTKFDQPLFGLQGMDGTPTGFDVEIAKIIAGGLGIAPEDIEWVETKSAIREEVLEQDTVDLVVATYTINDKRKERISFAGPYYTAGQALMVAAGNPKAVDGPESLKTLDATVCSVTGSTPSEKIKEYLASESQLVLFDAYSQCADALRTGQVDVVTTDNVILTGLVDQSADAFELLPGTFTEEPYGIGITKGDTAFCEYVNETLAAAAEDGQYEAAWTATAGTVDPEVPELPAADACA